jgi:hypothetical protein
MVQDEWRTLSELTTNGKSIARFGDGEFKMMDGAGYVREPPNKKLAAELRNILRHPHPNCLVAIPTMDPAGAKVRSWLRHRDRFARILRKSHVKDFYSAFISRPDSAQWIRTREFALEFAKLWADKRVAVLCENESGTLRAIDAVKVTELYHVVCPSHEAYKRIDEFEQEIAKYKPQVAILSCGMTATCLANRLTKRGIQAIDFGSGGSFIAKLLMESECSPS